MRRSIGSSKRDHDIRRDRRSRDFGLKADDFVGGNGVASDFDQPAFRQ
jgi:hypothetical protein